MTDYSESAVEVDMFVDSDYGTSIASRTETIASAAAEYFEQNGRRYLNYFGPNKISLMPADELELERLDVVNEFTLLIMSGKTHIAPLGKEHRRVLDLGTGSGVWAVDFAQENPETEVLGIDLSPPRPTWTPNNCVRRVVTVLQRLMMTWGMSSQFEFDDCEAPWQFKERFDFIHARMISQAVSDWTDLLQKVMDNLNPGGYFEMGEYFFGMRSDDNTLPSDWPPRVVFDLVIEALDKLGRRSLTGNDMREMLLAAGFVDVHVKRFKMPVGPWAKRPALKQAGALYNVAALEAEGYEAYSLQLLTRVLGMDEGETVELCKKARAAHEDRRHMVHAYFEFFVAWGRKPDSGTSEPA